MISHKYYCSKPKSAGLGGGGCCIPNRHTAAKTMDANCWQDIQKYQRKSTAFKRSPTTMGIFSVPWIFCMFGVFGVFGFFGFFIGKLWRRQLRKEEKSAHGTFFWFVWVLLACTKPSPPHSSCSSPMCFSTHLVRQLAGPHRSIHCQQLWCMQRPEFNFPRIKESANASVDQGSNCERLSTVFAGDVGHFC